MGNVLPFDKKGRIKTGQPVNKPEGEVIMFTGVRYERDPDGGPDPKKTPDSKRGRKRG